MRPAGKRVRRLGTMVAYGFPEVELAGDLAIARRLGAFVLEVFPNWREYPDPANLAHQVQDSGFVVHSAHGCWSSQSIVAPKVNLAELHPARRRASVDDLKRCVDWLCAAGGTCLVVHPGGVCPPAQFSFRRESLFQSLLELADHAHGTNVVLCVENMPPGVNPGSRMADVAAVVAEINRPEVALAIDTGHGHISTDVCTETIAGASRLLTTHVHDNDGKQDVHLPPGHGSIDWSAWSTTLDDIHYSGPIILECIRYLRRFPESITPEFLSRLRVLTGASDDREADASA